MWYVVLYSGQVIECNSEAQVKRESFAYNSMFFAAVEVRGAFVVKEWRMNRKGTILVPVRRSWNKLSIYQNLLRRRWYDEKENV